MLLNTTNNNVIMQMYINNDDNALKQHVIIKLQVIGNDKTMSSRAEYNIKLQRNKQQNDQQSNLKAIKHKTNKLASLDYKGMTLKEYFRLSEVEPYSFGGEIKEDQDQNACSSKQANTPYFNEFDEYNGRQKIKTQVYEQKSFMDDKPTQMPKQKTKQILSIQNRTKHLKVQKLPLQLPQRQKKDQKNGTRNKRATTLASNKDHLNRSTITSFYQIEEKKKKMLEKVKQQKQRINQLKLSDAFFITKYAEKFKINPRVGY